MRNQELQWYQEENALCKDGLLIIEGRREEVMNNRYDPEATAWQFNRKTAHYTSSSIHTGGKIHFQYGRVEVRARIDTSAGMWPAIWTLGVSNPWPANGEIDIMEYYLVNGKPHILANAAWADVGKWKAIWDDVRIPFSHFLENDPKWPEKFHIWKMDWTADYIRLYLDDELLNEIDLTKTHNPDGFNPFHQPHYLLLNLAIGGNGGNPEATSFPRRYEVDYVRVYQQK